MYVYMIIDKHWDSKRKETDTIEMTNFSQMSTIMSWILRSKSCIFHNRSLWNTQVCFVWANLCDNHCDSNRLKRSWLKYKGLPRLENVKWKKKIKYLISAVLIMWKLTLNLDLLHRSHLNRVNPIDMLVGLVSQLYMLMLQLGIYQFHHRM